MSKQSHWRSWQLQDIFQGHDFEKDSAASETINESNQLQNASQTLLTNQAESSLAIDQQAIEAQSKAQWLLELSQLKEESYQAGYQEGYQIGLQKAAENLQQEQRAELTQRIEILTAPLNLLADNFQDALKTHQQLLIQQLTQLVIEATESLSGQLLTPERLIDDIQQLLELPLQAANSPVLLINQDDFNLIEKHFGNDLKALNWQLRIDQQLQRGDCRIESDQQIIESTYADRLARLQTLLTQRTY